MSHLPKDHFSRFSYTSVTSYPNASIIAKNVLLTTFSFFHMSRFTYEGVILISFANSACVFSFSIHLTFTSTSILFLSIIITRLSIANNCMNRTIYCGTKSIVCIAENILPSQHFNRCKILFNTLVYKDISIRKVKYPLLHLGFQQPVTYLECRICLAGAR